MLFKSLVMFLAKLGVILSLCALGMLVLPVIGHNSMLLGVSLGGLVIANLVTLIVFYKDKANAKQDKQRISERTLVLLSALSLHCATYLVMHVTRHKTNKVSFQLKLLLAVSVQLVASAAWFAKVYI
ncbi:DUF1294 domain-containing protein [Pseudoalteromonas sp. SMS1]|uniref:DUF1294 domain-containing protein n=1 Tax=Pseudoalteromonas sp. SMS1 TaxID=2908894 RepID=UPI001F2A5103|nr:DUF1294 domain-containing protein [Pseudoalteromonas sp. SMS1]MCF2857020.1 DUF1294 domain-containing protein [Pseudoalteromonas sp. SMS1]